MAQSRNSKGQFMSNRTENPSTAAVVKDVKSFGRTGIALLAGVLIGAPISSWVRGFVAGRSRFLASAGLLGGSFVTVLAGWKLRNVTKLIPLEATGIAASIPMLVGFAEVAGIPGFTVPAVIVPQAQAPATNGNGEGTAGSLSGGRLPGGGGTINRGAMPGGAGSLSGGLMPGAGRNVISLPKRSTLRSVRR